MFQQLINHSPDLKRLRDEGHEIEVKGGYLLIHHIPYVNSSKEIAFGILVSELTLKGDSCTAKPSTHVINFQGSHPCNKDGTIISGIQHVSQDSILTEGVTVNHIFSNKPVNGYDDYYHKVTRYIEIISAPAKSLDKNVTEKTFKVIVDEDPDSPFQYIDTNSSRANIGRMNIKLKGQKMGIIGLGGTGAYILDLVAKTQVGEIHLFDGDYFHLHNAFRSPGAASLDQLRSNPLKVDYYAQMYSNMHKGIIPHQFYIDEKSYETLLNLSYVFICVDSNQARYQIVKFLIDKQIPFIDVGLGVNQIDDYLIGTIRVTSADAEKNDHFEKRISKEDFDQNEYSTNIQISELNALNATLAVIKWKKMCHFYQDLEQENHCTYSINVAQLHNDDFKTSVR